MARGSVSQQSISWGKAFSWLFTELWYKMFCIPLSGVGTEELLLLKCTNSCKLLIQIAESCCKCNQTFQKKNLGYRCESAATAPRARTGLKDNCPEGHGQAGWGLSCVLGMLHQGPSLSLGYRTKPPAQSHPPDGGGSNMKVLDLFVEPGEAGIDLGSSKQQAGALETTLINPGLQRNLTNFEKCWMSATLGIVPKGSGPKSCESTTASPGLCSRRQPGNLDGFSPCFAEVDGQ